MAIFTVHIQEGTDASLLQRAEKAVFIRDGFKWTAFIFGPFWLLFNKLWLEFLSFIALSMLFGWVATRLHIHPVAISALSLISAFWLGLEASNLLRWKLARKKMPMSAIVQGTKNDDAERRFFSLLRVPPLSVPITGLQSPVYQDFDNSLLSNTSILGVFPEPERFK